MERVSAEWSLNFLKSEIYTYIYYVYVKYIFLILFKKKEIEGDKISLINR